MRNLSVNISTVELEEYLSRFQIAFSSIKSKKRVHIGRAREASKDVQILLNVVKYFVPFAALQVIVGTHSYQRDTRKACIPDCVERYGQRLVRIEPSTPMLKQRERHGKTGVNRCQQQISPNKNA